jgi:hypothetical protein
MRKRIVTVVVYQFTNRVKDYGSRWALEACSAGSTPATLTNLTLHSSVWPEHSVWGGGVPGSNPGVETNLCAIMAVDRLL